MPQTCPGSVVSPDRVQSQLGLIALLVGLTWSVGVSLGASAATSWTVCASDCDYSSIKDAIASPTTLDGDTLAIAAGIYTEPGILVDKSLTLQGEDPQTTIVQAATTHDAAMDRVFTIPGGVTVTLERLTMRHGNRSYGGGLLNDGTLTLRRSTVRNNRAGVVTSYAYGGGLFNRGTLTLWHSTVHDNTGNIGGGLAHTAGALMLWDSTVSGNTAPNGGGLYNWGALTLWHSTVRDNRASQGGGVLNYGPLTLHYSTVSGNTATGGGGGFYNRGTLTLRQSTVSGNRANAGKGAGLYNRGTLTLRQSTVSGNLARSVGGGLYNFGGTGTLRNSLVAGNTAEENGPDCATSDPLRSHGYNLVGDGTGCPSGGPGDLTVDPAMVFTNVLGPLQDNGGPTFTHALLPGSPAIDAIPWGTDGCGTTVIGDQRWRARPQPAGGACDIGAYEVTVAGQPLSAWVTGLTPHTAVCKNATTGQEVTLNDPLVPWDCEEAGLAVTSGDQVTLRVRGPVQQGTTGVGGAVVGMAPRSGGCTNRTTGQQVTFQHMVGATAGSCVAAGLVVQPGDHVQIHVQGVME